VLGFVLPVVLAFLRSSGPRPVRAAVGAYVEFVRNTPFLVQLFIIYFALPGSASAWRPRRPH
jgi:polar amino acid transport system permease protein